MIHKWGSTFAHWSHNCAGTKYQMIVVSYLQWLMFQNDRNVWWVGILSVNFKWCDNNCPKIISNRLNICFSVRLSVSSAKTKLRVYYSVTLMLIANVDLVHGMWRNSQHREHRRCIPENLHWLSYQWDFPSKRMHFCAFWPEIRATTSFGFVRRRIPENLCVLALRPK